MINLLKDFVVPVLSPLLVGVILWLLGTYAEKRKLKADAIRDLMTYRGDYASTEFRRSMNKIAVTFHDDEDIRKDIRHLYEVINSPGPNPRSTERAIVGLIYKLCQRNGFHGLTEYDIDQAFPESKQSPDRSFTNIEEF